MQESSKIEALFRLVRSMDDREKRLYRRNAGLNLRNGKSNYLELFNILEGLKEFDHGKFLTKVEHHGLSKHLPTLQSRLFDHILDFLRQSEELPSVERKLNIAYEKIEMLYQRGLPNEAKKELNKAQQLAIQYDKYHQLLRLADIERQYFFVVHNRHAVDSIDETIFRDSEWVNNLHGQVELKLMNFELQFATKRQLAHSFNREKLDQILEGKSMRAAIAKSSSSSSDMNLLDIIGTVAQLEGEFDLAYFAYSKLDQLWVSSADKILENAQNYISYMTRFLNSCLLQGRFNEFRNLLANLKTVHFGKPTFDLTLKELLLYLELIFCLNRCEFEKGLQLEPEIAHFVANYRYRIDTARLIAFYFNLFSLHFLQAQYRMANRWLVKILNMQAHDYRKDIQEAAPLLQLIVFLASNDHDLLALRLRAYTRSRAGAITGFGAIIIQFCNQVLKNDKEEAEILSNFEKDLNLHHQETKGTRAGFGECLFWAIARRTGKLPGEVLKDFMTAQASD